MGFAQLFLRYNADWDRRLEGEILQGDVAGEVIHLLRVPVGVVAAICPWNYPLAVLCRKIAPALLTGNTVVIKPSEVTPLSTLEAIRLIDQHLDVPRGVINVVVGGPAYRSRHCGLGAHLAGVIHWPSRHRQGRHGASGTASDARVPRAGW